MPPQWAEQNAATATNRKKAPTTALSHNSSSRKAYITESILPNHFKCFDNMPSNRNSPERHFNSRAYCCVSKSLRFHRITVLGCDTSRICGNVRRSFVVSTWSMICGICGLICRHFCIPPLSLSFLCSLRSKIVSNTEDCDKTNQKCNKRNCLGQKASQEKY